MLLVALLLASMLLAGWCGSAFAQMSRRDYAGCASGTAERGDIAAAMQLCLNLGGTTPTAAGVITYVQK